MCVMRKTRISHILNRLLSEKKIRVTELARLVKLPQPTVHRIVNGVCEYPRPVSLKPIADFFSITVEQLRGLDPIPWLEQVTKVPLLSWQHIAQWPGQKATLHPQDLILTDAQIGENGYATRLSDASMDPVFPKGVLLIADPDRAARDRSFVIVKRAEHDHPIFRQIFIDGQDRYLKPLSPDLSQYKMSQLNNNDKILSVVLQAKRDCEE